MIVLMSREGQMCNQLISLATVFALGLEYECDVLCPVIDARLLDSFVFHSNRKINNNVKMYESILSKQVISTIKVLKRLFPTIERSKYNRFLSNSKKQFFFNRISFLEENVLIKHLEEIREYFNFKRELLDHCSREIEIHKKDNDKLIGVHIRRGDYSNFNGGRWFYSDIEYSKWMKVFLEKEKVKFLICSNENIDRQLYKEMGIDIFQPGHSAVEDLCLLSMCDFVMGPPSTFSLWAAMIGNKRRCILASREEMYSWDDFKFIEDRVMNGEEIQ